MAAAMKKHEVEATEALVGTACPWASNPAKVPAAISAKAAAINMEKSHTKIRKKRFPALPT